MKAICNTSPIIGLSIIDHLDLLWKLFDVYIPQEVYNEIVIKSNNQAFGKIELETAVEKGFINDTYVENQ